MDWNPFNSSLFNGNGTPWGPSQYGAPTANYLENPYDPSIHAPDQSAFRRAMMSRIAANSGQNQANALAGLQKAGVQGADTARAIGRVANEQGVAQGNLEAGLGQQDFQNRLGLMEAINNSRRQKYMQDLENYQNEEQGRAGFWQSLGKMGGKVAGGAMLATGNPAGLAFMS